MSPRGLPTALRFACAAGWRSRLTSRSKTLGFGSASSCSRSVRRWCTTIAWRCAAPDAASGPWHRCRSAARGAPSRADACRLRRARHDGRAPPRGLALGPLLGAAGPRLGPASLPRTLGARRGVRARGQRLSSALPAQALAGATNNACERDLRPAVIQRKVTNGYRAMWAAQGEADVRTVVDTARLAPNTSVFGTILTIVTV